MNLLKMSITSHKHTERQHEQRKFLFLRADTRLAGLILVLMVLGLLPSESWAGKEASMRPLVSSENDYVVIGWNDLGMHCINPSYKDLALLPPFNNLWVQVIQRGDPPKIVTSGISLEYSIVNNTTV
jgi:hypothetical protein